MNYFDLHCDTPYECFTKGLDFFSPELAVNANKGTGFEDWHQCFAIWIKDDLPDAYRFYRAVLADFKQKLSVKPQNLTPILTVEGGAVLGSNIDRLNDLHNDGIRAMTLTWNGENRIAGGSKTNKTLTAFGKKVIAGMNTLSMAVDLSHLNTKSFYAAIELADHPIASHSNCCAVLPHLRNLKDDQMRLIAQKKGIVGLCIYPEFLGKNVFEAFYENIVHLLSFGYEDVIAIGSDFDGATMAPELDSVEKMAQLYDFLAQKSVEKPLLDKIFYTNAQKFFASL